MHHALFKVFPLVASMHNNTAIIWKILLFKVFLVKHQCKICAECKLVASVYGSNGRHVYRSTDSGFYNFWTSSIVCVLVLTADSLSTSCSKGSWLWTVSVLLWLRITPAPPLPRLLRGLLLVSPPPPLVDQPGRSAVQIRRTSWPEEEYDNQT